MKKETAANDAKSRLQELRNEARFAAVAGLKALMRDDPVPGVDIRQFIDLGRA